MAKVVKVVLPIALSIVGGLIGGPLGAMIGTMVGTALASQIGKPKVPETQAQTTTLSLGEGGREAVLGLALTGGSMMDAFNYGGKYRTDWEVLPIALADHLCDGLVGFYVGDKYVAYTGDGVVPGYNGQLKIRWHAGTADQAADPTLMAQGGWAATDRLPGMCYVVVEYKADASDAKNPVWSSGRPSFSFLLRGKRCYQARKDSTVAGGSGPHRWNDPTTWEWTDNPIDCRYNFVRGIYACDRVDQPGQLLVGRGLSAAEAPPERVAAPANICDELVALAGGGSEKRYRIGAVINALTTFDRVEDEFAKACAGIILQPQGSIEIEPGHAKAPVAYITDDDLIVGKPVSFADYRSEADEEWCNTVIPRYVEPTQRWIEHGAPIRRSSGDLVIDGGPRERTLQLGYVTSGTQAQRCGETVRRLGRLWRKATITLGPRFSELEEGDWIVYTSARRTKGLPVTFRVDAFSLDEARQNTLTLREIKGSVFAWTNADEIAPGATAQANTPADGYGVPDVGTWTLAGVSIGPDGATLPALTFSGAVEDAYVSAVRFEYRLHVEGQAAGSGWLDGGLGASNATSRSVTSVESGQTYDGAVSYSFPGGRFGERLILGPVTAGTLSTGAQGARRFATQTVAYPLSSDDSHIYVAAFSGVVDGVTVAVPAATIAGLATLTYFAVFFAPATSTFVAEAHPAFDSYQNNGLIFIDLQGTSSGGTTPTYPPSDTPPPGSGGGGRYPNQQAQ